MRFTGAWWATVFPLGMYSATTSAMTTETRWQPFQTLSTVAFWIAFASWLLVASAAAATFARARSR
jgi:tellurite resistance protein TehA-like permease